MKNTYRIDEKNQIVYIDAFTSHKKECFVITISLSKLKLALQCNGSWILYGKGKLYSRGYVKDDYMKSRRIDIHRHLTQCPDGFIVDHLDGNPLNNCDDNLRICNHTANNQNASIRKDNSTGYIGVSRAKNGKFKATISVDGKNKYIGIYSTEIEASNAYQLAKQQLHPYADKNAMIFI
jgi:hypothetical protein